MTATGGGSSSSNLDGQVSRGIPGWQSQSLQVSGSIDMTGESDDEGQDARTALSNASAFLSPSPSTRNAATSMSSPSNMQISNVLPVGGDHEATGVKAAHASESGSFNLTTPSFRQNIDSSASLPTVLQSSPSTHPFPDLSHSRGWASSLPTAGSPGVPSQAISINGRNDFGKHLNGHGISASSAIDLTNAKLPSPPPVSDKKPICIGSIQSKAIM